MPRTLVTAPGHNRTRSLGWLALAWMEYFTVHGPGDVQGELVRHGDEYSGFIADCYHLDERGKLQYDSAFLSRPKGCDKSGLGARLALFEGLGPCRFEGWAEGGETYQDPWGLGFEYTYQSGEPMGRPVRVPFIRILATEENQTGNTYDSVYYNLTDESAPLFGLKKWGLFAGVGKIDLPGGGEIVPSSASGAAKDGGKETFVVFDETHLYITPELRRMYATVTRNMRKRKKIAGTWYLETTTMFAPGQESTAEETFNLAEAIREGKTRRTKLLYDHRWGECEDASNEELLRQGLIEAYGDALEWIDLDGMIDEFYNLRAKIADSRRYFLNSKTSVEDAWITDVEWDRCLRRELLEPGEAIALGFDGSINSDSTALVACRISDGHLTLLAIDEKPVNSPETWEVDTAAIDAEVVAAFETYSVVAFFADPNHWRDYLDRWTAQFADGVPVKAPGIKPFEFWATQRKQMVDAFARFNQAVTTQSLSHDGNLILRRHALNGRRRMKPRIGLWVEKEYPKSPNKIDAIMAATLAYEARQYAVAAGHTTPKKQRSRRLVRF